MIRGRLVRCLAYRIGRRLLYSLLKPVRGVNQFVRFGIILKGLLRTEMKMGRVFRVFTDHRKRI